MNEGEVVLTPEQIQTLRGYAFRGDTYGGWRYLASLGDRYADDAAAIVGKDANLNGLNLWMKKGVENLWDDTVGKKPVWRNLIGLLYNILTNIRN
ncbi:hypothetical protein [Neisseria meningitidis]|uniref:hypothetical protein n=1 Tax=Neisseria meningitidis TaxID=487 RepID=UPI0031010A07